MNIRSIATRAAWTAAQAGVGALAADLANTTIWWAVPVAAGLAAAKTWLLSQGK